MVEEVARSPSPRTLATSLLPPQIFQRCKISSLERASRFGFSSLCLVPIQLAWHTVAPSLGGSLTSLVTMTPTLPSTPPSPTFKGASAKNSPNPTMTVGIHKHRRQRILCCRGEERGLFSSDAALFTNPISAEIVKHFKEKFLDQFPIPRRRWAALRCW